MRDVLLALGLACMLMIAPILHCVTNTDSKKETVYVKYIERQRVTLELGTRDFIINVK